MCVCEFRRRLFYGAFINRTVFFSSLEAYTYTIKLAYLHKYYYEGGKCTHLNDFTIFFVNFSLHFTNLLQMLSMHTRKSDFLFRYGLSAGFGVAYFCMCVCIVFVFICVCVCNIVGPANRTRRDLPCTHKNQTKAPSARKQLKRRKCASD